MNQIMDDRDPNISYEQNTKTFQTFFNSLLQLLRQYRDVIVKPSVTLLRMVGSQATWTVVLLQFLLLVLVTTTMDLLAKLIPLAALHSITAFRIGAINFFSLLPSPLNGITFILVSFFVGLLTAYFFSRFFGGMGTFVAHVHVLLVCTIPLVTMSGLLLLLPATGPFVILLASIVGILFAYRLVLHTLTILAIHDLAQWKAILIAFIIPMLIVMIGIVIITEGQILEGIFDGFEPAKKRERSANL